jgi:raffinose/stachyose/melibiose transport system permease protein
MNSPVAAVATGGSSRQKRAEGNLIWYLFLAPAVALLAAFTGVPLYKSLELSFYKWNGLRPPKWIGLENFVDLPSDPYFWLALQHTLVFALVETVCTITLGLILALAISRRMPGHALYRFAFYLPAMVPAAVAAALWARILEPNYGVLNTFLRVVGLNGLALPWLADVNLSLWTVIAVAVWNYCGFPIIVLLAAIEGIPEDLHDAATLDGVNAWSRLRHVIIPLIWPVLVSISVIQLIFSLKIFDIVWVMTRGGPAESTSVLGTYLYKTAFEEHQFGYASAIAMAMFSIIFTITYLYYKLSKAQAIEYS